MAPSVGAWLFRIAHHKCVDMERASVLLEDVLDYRMAVVAEVVDSMLGGVQAVLHRGRARLRAMRSSVQG